MKLIFCGFLFLPVVAMAQDLSWPDPVANHVVPYQSTAVTHGPVLGDVTKDSVRIWLRADCREKQIDHRHKHLGG